MRLDARTRAFDPRFKDQVDLFVGKGGRVRANEVVNTQDLTGGSTAVITLSNFIPANSWLWGVFVEVLADIQGTVADFDVGDGTDVDRWGGGIALTSGTRTTTDDYTAADSFGVFLTSATDVVIQDDGILLFTGGILRIGALFLNGSADIRRR